MCMYACVWSPLICVAAVVLIKSLVLWHTHSNVVCGVINVIIIDGKQLIFVFKIRHYHIAVPYEFTRTHTIHCTC